LKIYFFKRFGTAKTIYLSSYLDSCNRFTSSEALSDTDTGNAGILFFANRFLLIYSICILFDLKDKEYDIQRGIKSIITILDEKKIELLFFICLILFFLSSLVLYIFRDSGLMVLTLISPGALLLFLFQKSKETKSDYWFSFFLDGMMMLSPILYLIAEGLKKF
jgi:4-hydroxybenzoate polyprenyltransferase